MDQGFVKDRLRLLLDHFAVVGDPREACKVRYRLSEVLFLVVCASIAGCDDYDEIADWGVHQPAFLVSAPLAFSATPDNPAERESWSQVTAVTKSRNSGSRPHPYA